MTNKTRWTKVLLCVFVIAAVTLTAGGVITLKAQGPPGTINPFTAVLEKLDQILAILAAPPPGPVVLSTPLIQKGANDLAGCQVANVGTETISIGMRQVNVAGGTAFDYGVINLQPGHSLGGFGVGNGAVAFRCEFSFEGQAAAVRASLGVINTAFQPLVSVDAR